MFGGRTLVIPPQTIRRLARLHQDGDQLSLKLSDEDLATLEIDKGGIDLGEAGHLHQEVAGWSAGRTALIDEDLRAREIDRHPRAPPETERFRLGAGELRGEPLAARHAQVDLHEATHTRHVLHLGE